MKIFSKAIATGEEWKPCIECGKVFVCGEIISSISSASGGCNVTYWYCYRCIARFFPMISHEAPGYIYRRWDRFFELEKSNNCQRYIPYNNTKWCLQN